jgi:WD40 repeat protein
MHERMRLEGHTNSVTAVAFSPDGTRLLTGSEDNTARLWDISDLEKGDAFQIACQRLFKIGRGKVDLRDVEQRYGLDPLPPICGDHPPAPVDLGELR